VIDAATRAELAAVGYTVDMLNDPDGEGQPGFVEKYATNPSGFCKLAWDKLGPNGTYKRPDVGSEIKQNS
jgi:hypothetical protein